MNIINIFIAAVAAFIVAFLWNGPLFGKTAMRLGTARDLENGKPTVKPTQILLNFLVFLVTAFIMSGVFWIAFSSPLMGIETWYKGVIIAIWLWLGFIVTSTSIEVIWKGRSWKLWLFECAASLVAFSIMGAILAGF